MKKIIYIILILVFCTSCENDLKPDFSDMQGVLTINAYLYTNQDTNFVFVSRTSNTNPQYVDNAIVEMRVNGELQQTVTDIFKTEERYVEVVDEWSERHWTEPSCSFNGVYMLTQKFAENDVVRIDVYADNQHAWAESVAPQKIENAKAECALANHSIGKYSDWKFADFSINQPDVSPKTDYYRIAVLLDYKSDRYMWQQYGLDFSKNEQSSVDSLCQVLKAKYADVVVVENDDCLRIFCLEKFIDYKNVNVSSDFFYNGDAILSEGETPTSANESGDETSDTDIVLGSVKNINKVYSDHLFSNKTANIHISVPTPFYNNLNNSEIIESVNYLPEDELLRSGSKYNLSAQLVLQSITSDQFFYLKALNAVASDAYEDMSELSGSLKIPSNVTGGCGNINITTNTVFDFCILEDFEQQKTISKGCYYDNDYYDGGDDDVIYY